MDRVIRFARGESRDLYHVFKDTDYLGSVTRGELARARLELRLGHVGKTYSSMTSETRALLFHHVVRAKIIGY